MSRSLGRSHPPFGREGLIAVVLLLALGITTASSAAPNAPAGGANALPSAVSVQAANGLEAELLGLLNSLRARNGLRPLRRSDALAAAARHHSRAMARVGFFGHASADGSSWASRVARFYRRPRNWHVYLIGENLVQGSAELSAAAALRQWLESPPHRRNLFARWREVGFGAVRVEEAPGVFGGESVTIVTADFGVRG